MEIYTLERSRVFSSLKHLLAYTFSQQCLPTKASSHHMQNNKQQLVNVSELNVSQWSNFG